MYISQARPDIPYAINLVSMFMQEPKDSHRQAARNIPRYTKGRNSIGFKYLRNGDSKSVKHGDSDWAKDIDTWRSTSGYTFHLGAGPVT